MVNISELEKAIRDSWDASTSSCPESWDKSNPACGQCAVTALVVNDYLGGELVWAGVMLPSGDEVSHYFNIVNSVELDLTKEQFPEGSLISEGVPKCKGFSSTRDYVLSYPVTMQRYCVLRDRVEEKLG